MGDTFYGSELVQKIEEEEETSTNDKRPDTPKLMQ